MSRRNGKGKVSHFDTWKSPHPSFRASHSQPHQQEETDEDGSERSCSGQSSKSSAPYVFTGNEWTCLDCGTFNFDRRYICYRCKRPKRLPVAKEASTVQRPFSTAHTTNGRFSKIPDALSTKLQKLRTEALFRTLKVTIYQGEEGRTLSVVPQQTGTLIQEQACIDLVPAFQICLSCSRAPSERNSMCRFLRFRGLDPESETFTFLAAECTQMDIDLWSPTMEANLTLPAARYIFKTVYGLFETMFQAEMGLFHDFCGAAVPWKPTSKYVMQFCDICACRLFNFHWMCEACGFNLCPDCGNYDPESWGICLDGSPHTNEKFLPVRLIPGDALTNLHARASIIMSMEEEEEATEALAKLAMDDSWTVKEFKYSENDDDLLEEFRNEWEKGRAVIITDVPLDDELWCENKPMTEERYAALTNDLKRNMPLKKYTLPNGELNLTNRLPPVFVESVASATTTAPTSAFRVHLSDNMDVFRVAKTDVKLTENAVKKIQKADAEKVGSLWHVWEEKDVPKLMAAIQEIKIEQQQIHDFDYINEDTMKILEEKYGIQPRELVQLDGDAVFLPSGYASQSKDLKAGTRVNVTFTSPETLKTSLKFSHPDYSYENVLYHAVKDCVYVLLALFRPI